MSSEIERTLASPPTRTVGGDSSRRSKDSWFRVQDSEYVIHGPETPNPPISKSPNPQIPNPAPLPAAATEDQLLTVDLHKSYRKGAIEVPVLRGVGMNVRRGEFLAIVGQSGSGKSTLLHLLGTLDAPDQGEIYYSGGRIDNLPASARDALRNHHFGMIFQFYHLLPELTTLENVLAPLMITHSVWAYLRRRRRHRRRAEELLDLVGLSHRLKHRPRELSGGEMQRAAIARALVAQPALLLADEPTGNLDETTGQDIIRILRTLNREQNLTIVMVTHDRAIADQADRIVRLAGGKTEE
jgi:lipoprotein-releasing system ATP-binding protein